jgi:hypothetical protein
LDQSCKSYKRNKKTEKEKGKRKEKKGLQEPFGPVRGISRGPINPPKPVPLFSLFLSLTCGPHMSGHLIIPNLQPDFLPGSSPNPLSINSVDLLPISSHPCAYKIRPISFLSCTPFSPLSAAKLHEIEHAIPQMPPWFTDDSGELRPPQAYLFAPFPS